ncbi:hypothetical protein KKH27_12155 [bacterium]|nr:hypothetical protein [bacterium]MBU1983277.1 hypothetical protein [bacterium]
MYSIALDTQVQTLAAMLDNPQKLLKQWVSGQWRPGRRDEHQRIDGQQVPVTESFRLYDGRIKLMYPRDPSGPPGETINCGCSWVIVPESLVAATSREKGLKREAQVLSIRIGSGVTSAAASSSSPRSCRL